MIHTSQKEDGFDEVFDSQKIFRSLMDGMSRPGKVIKLGSHSFTLFPDGFNPFVLSVLKTLCDNNVSVAIGRADTAEWHRYLEINTGAVACQLNESDYVVFQGEKYDEDFSLLNPGSVEFPEDSATAVISVTHITAAQKTSCQDPYCYIRMAGPGIKDKNFVGVLDLDWKYINTFSETNAIFPLGIDVILVDQEGNIVCIPRTTKVEVV